MEYLEYFQDNWIERNYPLRMWHMYSLDGPRTNNNAEGWHSKIHKLAGKVHTNIYEAVLTVVTCAIQLVGRPED